MRTIAKLGLVILAGGLLLGMWLGNATQPDMKEPTAGATWRPGASSAVAEPSPVFAEPAPPYLAGGHRPDLDYEAEAWELPISAEEWGPLYGSDTSAYLEDYPDIGPPLDFEAELQAESAARAAADAAADAAEAANARRAPSSDVRKSDLARSGLY